MIRDNRLQTLVVLALLSALTACGDKAPKGQVVASVNGEEVTRREIAGEPQAADLPDGAAAQPALAAVLSGVIDRKLAVAEAQRLKLDRTPEYMARAQRVEEVMLSRALFERWTAELPPFSKKQVADAIARNPQRFAQRKLFLVDRIATAADKIQVNELKPLQTNDAIAAYLTERSQPYQRNRAVIDSATLAPDLYRRLIAVTPGYPLAIVQGGNLVAIAVVETRAAPLPPTQADTEARNLLKQAAVQQKLADLRKEAKITYQPGFRPSAPATSAGN